ncbi:competence type IV pilus minor pilin ComGE [Anaerococcus porci]|uniref:Type II secretion system protein n=1 Tax=Anaerococcus porci TaxID=2652269 RepID=A0A6N7VTY6_9FIRM|nr:competence type IV pilus minor pilin ComGE [Anaerococcus porci]MDY3006195.1 competence type IV pilus minor pilin ComGE [Anaerococcus porci]MSS77169.1 type II secretion system protein [Anaerococcus porci]
MNKKLKAFTLVEVIIGLFLISVIAMYLLPSLYSVYNDSDKIKSDSRLIFAMQEVLELYKENDEGTYIENCNGFDINVEISEYNYKLKHIKVYKNKYVLDLVVEK